MSDLAIKLGIKPGFDVCLLGAPAPMTKLLHEESNQGVTFYDTLSAAPYDLIFFWPTRLEGLIDLFAQLQRAILPDGAVWAVIPRQKYASSRGITLSWQEMQTAALQTDLVDNKTASLSEEDYATRFVIRKDRRGQDATDPAEGQDKGL